MHAIGCLSPLPAHARCTLVIDSGNFTFTKLHAHMQPQTACSGKVPPFTGAVTPPPTYTHACGHHMGAVTVILPQRRTRPAPPSAVKLENQCEKALRACTCRRAHLAELLRAVVADAHLPHEALLRTVRDAVHHRPLLQRRILRGRPVQLPDRQILRLKPPQRAPADTRRAASKPGLILLQFRKKHADVCSVGQDLQHSCKGEGVCRINVATRIAMAARAPALHA